jgi:type II secretion system protein I
LTSAPTTSIRGLRRCLIAGRAGFTLYEVLVATVIVAVGLVTVLRAVGVCLNAERRAEVTATVTMLAQEKMEEIAKEPTIAVGDDRGDYGDSFADYYWEAQIRQTVITGLDEVIVTVHYTLDGKDQEYILTALQPEQSGSTQQGGGAQTSGMAGGGQG